MSKKRYLIVVEGYGVEVFCHRLTWEGLDLLLRDRAGDMSKYWWASDLSDEMKSKGFEGGEVSDDFYWGDGDVPLPIGPCALADESDVVATIWETTATKDEAAKGLSALEQEGRVTEIGEISFAHIRESSKTGFLLLDDEDDIEDTENPVPIYGALSHGKGTFEAGFIELDEEIVMESGRFSASRIVFFPEKYGTTEVMVDYAYSTSDGTLIPFEPFADDEVGCTESDMDSVFGAIELDELNSFISEGRGRPTAQ